MKKFFQNWKAENLTKQDGVFPAAVPGNVQFDYAAAKNWPDYQYGDNSKRFMDVEDDTWEYSTELDFTAEPGETVWFCAKGIDYRCEIRLNGTLITVHEGSFSRIRTELTPYLQPEKNRLCVRILPHPKRKDAPVSRSQADEVCKAPVCYGWAWHPRLLVSGIWQEAWVEVCGAGRILDAGATYTLSKDLSTADVYFHWTCGQPVTVSLYDPQGEKVWSGTEREAHIENIQLWWCSGQGPQAMYTWVMESEEDRCTGKIGFRRGRLLMNEGAWNEPALYPKSRSDAPATFELNGRKIFLQGTNYLTPDIFTGRVTRETHRKLIELVRDAHMNVVRCWGGCGCQTDDFYELCDEMGILVWVEFPLACNLYSEEEPYLQTLEQEATEILLRLREHPSIAFWCGGNELFNSWSGMTEQHLALRLLDSLCYRFDRERPFLMTSPLNGMGHGNYMFFDRPAGKDSLALFRDSRCTAYTEFGPPAIGDMDVIRRVIPESSRVFPVPTEDPYWLCHYGTANNPEFCQEDALTFFPECSSLEELVLYSDLLQSMAYKCIFEESRRQWPHCSMAVNWCYNEPWYTVVNRHIVDYDCKPRPSYFAVKEALRPVLGTAGIPKFRWKAGETFTADIVLHNDTDVPVEREVTVTLQLGEEKRTLLCWKGICGPRQNVLAPSVRFILPDAEGERLLHLSVNLDDGTENPYTLRYLPAAKPPVIRRLNE